MPWGLETSLLYVRTYFLLSHDILGYSITLGIPSNFTPFFYPLELVEHMVYGWTNQRYVKGTLLLIESRISLSVGKLPKAKGIDKPKWTP